MFDNNNNDNKRKPIKKKAEMKKKKKASRKSENDFPLLGDDFQIIEHKTDAPKKKRSKWRTVLRVVVTVFLIGIISICLIIGGFMVFIFATVDPTIPQNLENLKLDYTSIFVVIDENGEEIELKRLHGEENRIWVDLKKTPPNLKNAFISVEDKRFESHQGVDWKRTFSAFANLFFDIYGREVGGSTITQQLVKNLTGEDDNTPMRKISEIMRARYIEGKYDKDTIIECYINTIKLGKGIDGVQVASAYYFDKDVSELSVAQMASLAAITRSPSTLNPIADPVKNKDRRNFVISEMYDQEYITKEEYETALNKEAYDNFKKDIDVKLEKKDIDEKEYEKRLHKFLSDEIGLSANPSTILSKTKTIDSEVNSWFLDAAIEDAIDIIKDMKGISRENASADLFKGGYKIYTTMDMKVQAAIDKVYKDDKQWSKSSSKLAENKGKNVQPQSAMVIVDFKGNIVGLSGGRGEKTENRAFNRATHPDARRQPGSAMKPIAAYAPAINSNMITFSSRVTDKPVAKVNNKDWPRNYTGTYMGATNVPYAIKWSLNTIPTQLVKDMGVDKSYEFMTEKLHFTSLVEADKNLSSLGVGGCEYGVTAKEMAAAYATFGSRGIYHKPTTIAKITDATGAVVYQKDDKGTRAMEAGTAGVMVQLLRGVPEGTARSVPFGSWPIYCKTGTTTENKDLYFVGATPYYCASVWYGFDKPEPMSGSLSGAAMSAWKKVMQEIVKNKEKKDFDIDKEDTVYIKYCTYSGKVAKTGCPSTAYGWFKKSYQPLCGTHGGSQVKPQTPPDYDAKPPREPTAAVTEPEATEVSEQTQATTEPPIIIPLPPQTAPITAPPTAAPPPTNDE